MDKLLTPTELIKLLEKKELIIDSYAQLKYYIRNYNYNYVIEPYLDIFIDSKTNLFYPNTKSSEIINLYDFDNKIALEILSCILDVEKKLNTNVAYIIIYDFKLIDKCLFKLPKYELRTKVFPHVDEIKENLSFNQFIMNLTRYCNVNTRTKDYEIKSKNAPLTKWRNCPIDVMCLSWSFATTFKSFFALNTISRTKVMNNFNIPNEHLVGFAEVLKMILNIRNLISHNDILYSHDLMHQGKFVYDLYKSIFGVEIQYFSLFNLAKIVDFFNDNRTNLYERLMSQVNALKVNDSTRKNIIKYMSSKKTKIENIEVNYDKN